MKFLEEATEFTEIFEFFLNELCNAMTGKPTR